MKKIDNYRKRIKMVEMHDTYLNNLEKAINANSYIEATWLCYSIFEQRITRLVEKYIMYCPKVKKMYGRPAGIMARLSCIKQLIIKKYNGFELLDLNLFESISKWCDKRNQLTHDLVNLKRYRAYDQEFLELAQNGYKLVLKLYSNISKYREWWYSSEEPKSRFPKIKCDCKTKCIYEKQLLNS